MKTLVFAIIGPLGVGKTTFIESMVNVDPTKPIPPIHLRQRRSTINATATEINENQPQPHDPELLMYPCKIRNGDMPFMLIDTPGLSPNEAPDSQMIRFIQCVIEGAGHKLNGIIYLQRITDCSMINLAVKNIHALCEPFKLDAFDVVVATTFWDALTERVAEGSEAYILGELLNRLNTQFSPARLDNTRRASVALIEFMQHPDADRIRNMRPITASEPEQLPPLLTVVEWHDSMLQSRAEGADGSLWERASQESYEPHQETSTSYTLASDAEGNCTGCRIL